MRASRIERQLEDSIRRHAERIEILRESTETSTGARDYICKTRARFAMLDARQLARYRGERGESQ